MKNVIDYFKDEVTSYAQAKEEFNRFLKSKLYTQSPIEVRRLLALFYFKIKDLNETILSNAQKETYRLTFTSPYSIILTFQYDPKWKSVQVWVEYDEEKKSK